MTSRFYDDIIRPVDRLWFANDACDQRGRRWIEGAVAAAVKNAYAIHMGMRNELPVASDTDAELRRRVRLCRSGLPVATASGRPALIRLLPSRSYSC